MKILIETDRLRLVEAVPDDSLFILNLLNSPTWLEFIGDKGVKTEEDALTYIQKSLMDSYAKNGFGLYKVCLKDSMEPIGICGFLKRDYLPDPDLGFALLPKFEGSGFMLEATRAMMRYGASHLQFNTILAIVMPENVKSQRLLNKIGFSKIDFVKPSPKTSELLLFSTKKSHSN